MAHVLAGAGGAGAPRPVITGQYRLGDVRHVFASPDRARRLLGFNAIEDFRAGMTEFSRARLRAA
jgi:dTDP-L-rhamnose 4-epimerase